MAKAAAKKVVKKKTAPTKKVTKAVSKPKAKTPVKQFDIDSFVRLLLVSMTILIIALLVFLGIML
jgi:hypothetical protein